MDKVTKYKIVIAILAVLLFVSALGQFAYHLASNYEIVRKADIPQAGTYTVTDPFKK